MKKKCEVVSNVRYLEGTLVVKLVHARKLYKIGKIIFSTSRLTVHHPTKEFIKNGSAVMITECKPVSKTKRWKICEVKE